MYGREVACSSIFVKEISPNCVTALITSRDLRFYFRSGCTEIRQNTEMDESNEKSTLLESPANNTSTVSPSKVKCKVYKRRWYILSVFTASAFIFNMAWNTWGPIQQPTKLALGWTDFDLLLLSSWAPISFIVSTVPLTWLMDSKGSRVFFFNCFFRSFSAVFNALLLCFFRLQSHVMLANWFQFTADSHTAYNTFKKSWF